MPIIRKPPIDPLTMRVLVNLARRVLRARRAIRRYSSTLELSSSAYNWNHLTNLSAWLDEAQNSLQAAKAICADYTEDWTEKWPTEPGTWWWLLAWVWGEKKPTLRPVIISNSVGEKRAQIASGKFLYDWHIEGPALWTPVIMPRPVTVIT